jgi:hypothetical protein
VESPYNESAKRIIREITNPTDAIINLLYLIKNEPSDRTEVLHYVAIAESQARCLVEVIQRVAAF